MEPDFTLAPADGSWTQFRFEFDSGDVKEVTLQITDMTIEAIGNDFALDDLELHKL